MTGNPELHGSVSADSFDTHILSSWNISVWIAYYKWLITQNHTWFCQCRLFDTHNYYPRETPASVLILASLWKLQTEAIGINIPTTEAWRLTSDVRFVRAAVTIGCDTITLYTVRSILRLASFYPVKYMTFVFRFCFIRYQCLLKVCFISGICIVLI